jgi:hypothetical protein
MKCSSRFLGLVVLLQACSPERPAEAPAGQDSTPVVAERPGATEPERPGANEPARPDSAPSGRQDQQEWTIGIVEAPANLTPIPPVPVLRAVRTASREGFDRLTVELAASSGMPGYHLEYVDRPLHQCGSGEEVHPVGSAWLEVRIEPANAHTEAGAPTLSGREIPADGRLLRRLYLTCDFEAVVTLVLAVDSPNPYRVLTLADPPRIVVDVRH